MIRRWRLWGVGERKASFRTLRKTTTKKTAAWGGRKDASSLLEPGGLSDFTRISSYICCKYAGIVGVSQ